MFSRVGTRLARMAAVAANAGQIVAQTMARYAAQKIDVTGAMRRQLQRKATKEARYSSLWTPNGTRECQRRQRQGAHALQRISHRAGTVQPRHIFFSGANLVSSMYRQEPLGPKGSG